MSFVLSDFIVEAIIRDNLKELQNSNSIADIIEDLFGNFLDTLLKTKYGQEQLNNLITYLQNSVIHVVNSLPDSSTTSVPQISIISQSDNEAEDLTALNDFPEEDYDEIEPNEIISFFTAGSYDNKTGYINVPDNINIDNVRFANYYIDGDGTEHRILTPINNEIGDKRFTIEKNLENLNVINGRVVSAIDRKIFQTSTIPNRENILIGIHTENSLLTRLLYHIIKYIIYKSKDTFNEKELQIITLQGSDLNQALQFLPNNIYHKFITMSFISYNKMRIKELNVIDSINTNIFVELDEAERTGQTIQTI